MTPAFSETLHFLDQLNGPRFAVVTHPVSAPTGTGVLLCNGGWFAGNWNFNRMYVTLARYLAEQGHTVVRFDWYGTGESPGFVSRFKLSEPYCEDVLGAAALLAGSDRIVGAGVCFGAASLLCAANKLDRLEGIVLVGAVVPGSSLRTPVRQIGAGRALRSILQPATFGGWSDPYTRRLFFKWFRVRLRAFLQRVGRHDRRARVSSDQHPMVVQIETLAKIGTRIQFLYGKDDSNLAAFSRPPLLSLTDFENVRVEVVPFDVASSSSLAAQEETSRAIAGMVEEVTYR